MKRMILAIVLALACSPAWACDGFAFSAGACYSSVVQSYAAPVVQAYVQPQAYVQQQVILPQRVAIVRPELRLEVQQAYGYAAPVVQSLVSYPQVFRQQVVKQQVVKQQVVRQPIVRQQVVKQQVVVQRQKSFVAQPQVTIQQRGLFGRRLNVRVQ